MGMGMVARLALAAALGLAAQGALAAEQSQGGLPRQASCEGAGFVDPGAVYVYSVRVLDISSGKTTQRASESRFGLAGAPMSFVMDSSTSYLVGVAWKDPSKRVYDGPDVVDRLVVELTPTDFAQGVVSTKMSVEGYRKEVLELGGELRTTGRYTQAQCLGLAVGEELEVTLRAVGDPMAEGGSATVARIKVGRLAQ